MCLLTLYLVPVSPTWISISSTTYQCPTPSANTPVGDLWTVDANVLDTYFVYTIVGGANSSLFNIYGNTLVLVTAGQQGDNLQVDVQSTDPEGFSFVRSLVISESLVVLTFSVLYSRTTCI